MFFSIIYMKELILGKYMNACYIEWYFKKITVVGVYCKL